MIGQLDSLQIIVKIQKLNIITLELYQMNPEISKNCT